MFKRIRWMGTGVAVGMGASVWLQRKLREAASRYGPAGVAAAAAVRAREALEEGRAAMREKEAQLQRRPVHRSTRRTRRERGASRP